jgi:hypothetical protein
MGRSALRNRLQFLPGAVAAALYAASAGVVAGAIGCVHAGSLAFGARTAAIGFLIASALIGYALWRAHRPQRGAFLDKTYHGQ